MLAVHKYDRVINFVEEGIKNGEFKLYSKLPSIHALQIKFNLSRYAVIQAMENLKARGIIEAETAVGYFVVNTQIRTQKKVLIIFGGMNPFKEDLYQTILTHLDKDVEMDISFHYRERNRLRSIIEQANGKYNVIVVMPGPMPDLSEILGRCKGTVLLLDNFPDEISDQYSSVFQDFKMDTYNALVKLYPDIRKYSEIVLAQSNPMEPISRFYGVKMFADKYNFSSQLVSDLGNLTIKKGTLYLVPNDDELVLFVKKMHNSNLVLAKDYGLISFNDCALKEVLENGITTISTDFHRMGIEIADMINHSGQEKTIRKVSNPWQLIIRNSI